MAQNCLVDICLIEDELHQTIQSLARSLKNVFVSNDVCWYAAINPKLDKVTPNCDFLLNEVCPLFTEFLKVFICD